MRDSQIPLEPPYEIPGVSHSLPRTSPGIHSQESTPMNPHPRVHRQESTSRSPQPGVHSQEFSARNPQPGVSRPETTARSSYESTAMSPQLALHSQEPMARCLQPRDRGQDSRASNLSQQSPAVRNNESRFRIRQPATHEHRFTLRGAFGQMSLAEAGRQASARTLVSAFCCM